MAALTGSRGHFAQSKHLWCPEILSSGRWMDDRGRRIMAQNLVPVEQSRAMFDAAMDTNGFLVDPLKGQGAKIQIYGVVHGDFHPSMARLIVEKKAKTVVVESAVCDLHGQATGTKITCSDFDPSPLGQNLKFFCQCAGQLRYFPDPLSSPMWKELEREFNGEFLVYIAAFLNEADLIYGDVPKPETFRELDKYATIEDLDRSLTLRAESFYKEILQGGHLTSEEVRVDTDNTVDQIMFLDREAAMCNELFAAAQRGGPDDVVVGVFGAEHILRAKEMLETRAFEAVLSRKDTQAPDPVAADQGPEYGLKRALMTAFLNQVGTSARETMEQTLGPLPAHCMPAYQQAMETYGSVRMLLACIDRPLLEQICCGVGCDVYDAFADVRAVRPVNGGRGYSDEVLALLKADRGTGDHPHSRPPLGVKEHPAAETAPSAPPPEAAAVDVATVDTAPVDLEVTPFPLRASSVIGSARGRGFWWFSWPSCGTGAPEAIPQTPGRPGWGACRPFNRPGGPSPPHTATHTPRRAAHTPITQSRSPFPDRIRRSLCAVHLGIPKAGKRVAVQASLWRKSQSSAKPPKFPDPSKPGAGHGPVSTRTPKHPATLPTLPTAARPYPLPSSPPASQRATQALMSPDALTVAAQRQRVNFLRASLAAEEVPPTRQGPYGRF